MGFRDVWQEGDGISLPTLKFEQMVSSRQLVRRSDGMYERNLDRKVAAFDGFETFFDERGPYSARPNDERVIVTRCETPIQSVKAVATAALSIPEHPRARWRERVVALGLARDDSDAEVLAWFRRASPRREHPDRRGNAPEAVATLLPRGAGFQGSQRPVVSWCARFVRAFSPENLSQPWDLNARSGRAFEPVFSVDREMSLARSGAAFGG